MQYDIVYVRTPKTMLLLTEDHEVFTMTLFWGSLTEGAHQSLAALLWSRQFVSLFLKHNVIMFNIRHCRENKYDKHMTVHMLPI